MTKIRDIYPLDDTIWSPLAKWLKYLDPLYAIRFIEHFLYWVAANWTITIVELGAGAAAQALDNVVGGVLKLTNDDAEDDSQELQLLGEPFKLVDGKRCWFEIKLQIDDELESDLIAGLCITDTTLLAGMTDGVYWQKDDGDAQLDFHAIKASTATDKTNIGTLTKDIWTRLGFYFDGKGSIVPYLNGVALAASKIITNIPDTEELTVSFGFANGEAVAKNLKVDYIKCVQQV